MPKTSPTKLAIQRHREQRGISMQDAADGAGVDVNTWRRWERGELIPRADLLFAIARTLGVSSEALNDWPVKPRQGHRKLPVAEVA
jgi:transcriptional regulator with XRE-family HTH domain